MAKTLWLVAFLILGIFAANSQGSNSVKSVPGQLSGRWIVKEIVPTTTISCWPQSAVDEFIGTELQYSRDAFKWKDVATKNPRIENSVLKAEQFHDLFSGGNASGSQVNFKQLGISQESIVMIEILHPPAEITGCTVEIPGDTVFLKDANTIIVYVGGYFFEAKRVDKPL
jgi:hypothetical protein